MPDRIFEDFRAMECDIFNLFIHVHLNVLGTCSKRRDAIEKDLNALFQEFMDQEFRIDEAYGHMISARPSKILSGWTYESKPKPLRSSRMAGEYRDTEVPETEDESNSPDYKEFCKLLKDGLQTARETQKTHFFEWRGYKACVSSQLPDFSRTELNRRYQLAIKSLANNEQSFFETTPMSSASARSTSSSSQGSQASQASSIISEEGSQELTQIPATQLQGKKNIQWRSCLPNSKIHFHPIHFLYFTEPCLNMNLIALKCFLVSLYRIAVRAKFPDSSSY